MFKDVVKNKFGFYELNKKPTEQELKDYYATIYYQETEWGYSQTYPDAEKIYLKNRIEQKCEIIHQLMGAKKAKKPKILDVGCGEGWTLDYFASKEWEVTGIDYSEFGCKNHNPQVLQYLIVGEVFEKLTDLVKSGEKFDVVLLDNVLEHVIDPLMILETCKALIQENGLLVIEVPNDFSIVQQHLFNNTFITESYWVAIPDHISYFNKEGLNAICNEIGLECKDLIADFPIDFDLFNEHSNFVNDRAKGSSSHEARIAIDNLFNSISIEKTINYYRALADLGLGRQIVGFYSVN